MPSPRASSETRPPADAVVIDRDDAEVYARWFQALSDPTRIVILSYLSDHGGPVPVGTIVDDLGIGQSTVSHHLRILHDSGFVTRERSRTNRLYAVNRSSITDFSAAAEVIMGRHRSNQDTAGTT
jgi:DNA-binding transcriptional ArsR family regulator